MNIATQIAVALLGCWEPATPLSGGEMTCVTLGAEANELRVITIATGRRTTESVLRLDGSRQPVDADGCIGWESARVSEDGERIHVSAEVTCENGPVQRRSAALMITPGGYWMHAEGTGIATVGNVQLQMLRPAFRPVPAELRATLAATAAEAEAARAALKRSRTTATDLIELSEMGMADAVIDVVVAAGHPKSFELGVGGEIAAVAGGSDDQRHLLRPMPAMYGFGYPGFFYDVNDIAFMYGCSSRYWGTPYSYYGDPRYCSSYSYSSYDYWRRYSGGYWPGTYPLGPVIIRPVEQTPSGGRVVRGQGYTNTGSTTGTRTAEPRSTTATGSSGSAGSTRSSGSGSSSSGSSSTGSSSGGTRTAQPRKP